MPVRSIYSYVDALPFPGRSSVNDAGYHAAGESLYARDAAGDTRGRADCFEFIARPPFHPVKFLCFLYQAWPAEIRIEGEFWVDNAPDERCEMLIARARAWHRVAGPWLAAARPVQAARQECAALPVIWDEIYGDRRQRLRIFSAASQTAAIKRQLDGCLIRDGSEFLRRAVRPHDDLPMKEMKNVI